MTGNGIEAENERLKTELDGLHDILSSLGVFVFTEDASGRYVYANPRARRSLEHPLNQVAGDDDSELLEQEVAALLQADDHWVLANGHKQLRQDKLVVPSTGQTRHYLTVKAPLLDAQKQVLGGCGLSVDITERLEDQIRLTESYQLFETVLNNAGAHIYVKDTEGCYLYANRQFLDSAHLTLDQVLGRTDADIFPTTDVKALRAVDAQVFATGQPIQAEEQVVDAEGLRQYYWSTKLLLKRLGKPDCLIGLSTPISKLKAAEDAITRSEARFRALFESSSEAVLVMSRTQFLDCNKATLQLLGVESKEEFLKLTPADLAPAAQPCGTPSTVRVAQIIDLAFNEGHHQFELVVRRHDDGVEIPVEAMVTVVELDGMPALLITLRDQTQRKRYEEQISRLAFYDPLTQLPNRRLLQERLSQALVQHHRSRHHGCVVYIDLDNFKPLNDLHGHGAGDLLLQEVGQRLVGCLRTQDTVSRVGGDEFVVLLIELDATPDVALTQGMHVAEKILKELARPYVLALESKKGPAQTVVHHCTASLGLALFGPGDKDIQDILRRADAAMYRAKANGRNRVCVDDLRKD